MAALSRSVGTLVGGAIVVGTVGAASGWRPSAWILVGAVAAVVAGHVAVAAVAYRRALRRTWPQVAPRADENDW